MCKNKERMSKKKIVVVSVVLLLVAFVLSVGLYYWSLFWHGEVFEMETVLATQKIDEFVITDDTAPTKSCHASTLAMLNGELYCAWFGGTHEGHPDVTIWLSKRTAEGWQTPIDMSDINDVAHYNPVLFTLDDTMYLYYKVGTSPTSWATYFRATTNGVDWSEEKLLTPDDDGRGPVKNKPILLSNGTVIAPMSYEYKTKPTQCYADITTDMVNYCKSERIKGSFLEMMIQPTFLELEPGHVVAFMRCNTERIFRSDSYDYGKTWTKANAIGLYNNNSGIDVAKNDDGVIALVHNPVGEDWGARTPLVVGLSYDGGDTFEKQIVLEDIEGEFSYPSIISVGSKFYVSYTYNRELVKFCEIEL